MEHQKKAHKTDRIFRKGLEKLSSELKQAILNQHYKVTKKSIMQLGLDDSISERTIHDISQIQVNKARYLKTP